MAYTATVLQKTVFGNERVVQFLVTSDAASGSVATGLQYVHSIGYAPVSMNSAGIKIKGNLDATSATANGTVFVSSTTTGDVFYLTVYGR